MPKTRFPAPEALAVALGAVVLALLARGAVDPASYLPSRPERNGAASASDASAASAPSPRADTSSRTAPAPAVLAQAFLPPSARAARAFAAPPAASAAVPAPGPAEAPWLRKVGSVQDAEGVLRLYFKDDRTGRVLAARTDGKEEDGIRLRADGPDSYLVKIDGEEYRVRRGR